LGGAWYGEETGARESISAVASRVRADISFAILDVLVVIAAYTIGLGLRMLDPLVGDPRRFWVDLAIAMPVIVMIHLTANAFAGAYGHVWEYASTSEAIRLVVANGVASAAIIGLGLLARIGPSSFVIPVLTLVVGGLLSFLMMGLVRFRARLFSYRKRSDGPRTLVVGVGADAARFAREAPEIEGGGPVVGFLNGQSTRGGSDRRIADLPVLGSIDEVAAIVEEHNVDQVVITGKDPDIVRAVVDSCLETTVRLRILPGAEDVMSDPGAPVDVRDIRVEDLLVRDPVNSDMSRVAELVRGKTVLVTGGGGSIGSEMVRQVLQYEPGAVWALDRDETLLHDAGISWHGAARAALGDVRDASATIRLFERIRPDVVFHAAALKHVPMLENHPEEAVLTNVIGTRNVIEAGSRVGVQHFVLISTDKAVDPSSVMGASKRVAEMLIKAGEARRDGCTYSAVRFGNVLGSRGSVIPTFVSQIRDGGPVTVTDPEMTRYFMTVGEAVQLVLQAASLARGSELFLLDMGDPLRIEDLARRLIRLAGLTPGQDIQIEYTGIRPGEKLEEVLADGPVNVTENPKIFEVPLPHPSAFVLVDRVADLEQEATSGQTDVVVEILNELSQGNLRSREETGSARGSAQSLSSWS
jgi:FlaA1/EpsC-like NDP-sugar epimerase